MTDTAWYITTMRNRGISSAEVSDVNLTAMASDVLRQFSRIRPTLKVTTFDTIADQQVYDWTEIGDPTGRTVLLCQWNPVASGDVFAIDRLLQAYGIVPGVGDYHMPSQAIIEQIKAMASTLSFLGGGYQLDPQGGDLYLTPTPDVAGLSVYVIYGAAVSDATSIPDADKDIFADLLDAACSERVCFEISKASNAVKVKTPEYERSVGEQIGFWRKNAKEKRASAVTQAQARGCAVMRT